MAGVAVGSGEPPWDHIDEPEEDDDELLNSIADISRLTLETLWKRMDRMERKLLSAIEKEKS